LSEKLKIGKCRLLLDALDETPLEDNPRQPTQGFRGELTGRLKRFADNSRCSILLTSRIVGYQGSPFSLANTPQQREMELVAFDRKQQEDFVNAWFSESERPGVATKLLNELQRATQIRGLAQVPLLLGLLCKLYWHNELTLPIRRVELYEKCLRGLLSEEWKKEDERRQFPEGYVDSKLELAEEIAYRFFIQGKEIFSTRELRQCIIETLSNFPDSHDLKGKKPYDLINELSVEDGLLIKAGAGDNPPYLFLHLTFQEYLTACALARRPDWLEEAKKHFWLELEWVEPLMLLAGVVQNPVPLLVEG
jgi:predicted NACHT family NTPase